MRTHSTYKKVMMAVVAACTAGTLFAASCGAQDIQAIAVGVEAAARQLDRSSSNSFTDWLVDGLNRL